jgi:hypothetical protein
LGVYQVEGEVALTWDPPNCLKSESPRNLFEVDKYRLFPEADDSNFGGRSHIMSRRGQRLYPFNGVIGNLV